MAKSVQPTRLSRSSLCLGTGHSFFAATFNAGEQGFEKPAVPTGSDCSTVAARHLAQTEDPLPLQTSASVHLSGSPILRYHYSDYQPHAGFQWRVCVCARLGNGLGNWSDISASLECGGPTQGGPTAPPQDQYFVKVRVWLFCRFHAASPSTSQPSLGYVVKWLDHTFDRLFPSVWTDHFCPYCPWNSTSICKNHASQCQFLSFACSRAVSTAITLKVNVILYPHEGSPVCVANNEPEKADDKRWSHPLDMLDAPESSSTDIVLQSRDGSTIRAHRCMFVSYAFFKVLLTSSFKEGSDGTARLSDISEHGMQLMVDWVSGVGLPRSLRQNAALLVELWVFGSVHNMKDMAESCRSIALVMACSENFTLLFGTAMKLSDKDTARKLTSAVSGSVDQIIDWI
jgi:hypothetical protein